MTFYNEFARHYDTVFPYRPLVKEFLQRNLPAEGGILDVGCGPGRYCAALAGPGRSVLGIDPDPGMIQRARGLFPEMRFENMAMEGLSQLGSNEFTGIYCVGNVLPHLPAGQLRSLLDQVDRILAGGGRWIVQTVNFDPLLTGFEHQFKPLEFPEQELVFERTYRNITRDRLEFHTRLERAGDTVFTGMVPLCPRSSRRLVQRHHEAGFHLLGHFGDFRETLFGPDSPAGILIFGH